MDLVWTYSLWSWVSGGDVWDSGVRELPVLRT